MFDLLISLEESSLATVFLLILFVVAAKIFSSQIIACIFRSSCSDGGDDIDSDNKSNGVFGIIIQQNNNKDDDQEGRRRSVVLDGELGSSHTRRCIVTATAAIVWVLYVCLIFFNYEQIVGRLHDKPLEDYRKFPGTKNRQVHHPDSGLSLTQKPYLFCYLLGGLAVVSYLAIAVVLRYGTRSGEVAAVLSPGMTPQQFANKKHPTSAAMYFLCQRRLVIFVVGLMIAAVGGLGVAAYSLSHYMLYCNYKQDEFGRLCDFAHEIKGDVESVTGNGTTWLHNGGLLAAWRPFDRVKNGFIANDHDFDMCIERGNFEKMKKYLSTSDKYYWSYWTYDDKRHPQKIRIYPEWANKYDGHSGMWCVDIDECHYRRDPLVVLDSCNGHFWHVPSKRDSVAYFEEMYPQGPWNQSIQTNHWILCALLPGF